MPRSPEFWRAGSGSLLPALLAPAASLYGWAQRVNRQRITAEAAGIPVISIGNVVAGGAGKTPTAIALARLLIEQGIKAGFVTRGYGGDLPGPLKVDPARHSSDQVGDEPLLLARAAPTWMGRDRVAAARLAASAGAALLIADDALQTHALKRDMNILVINPAFGFGNGRLLPAGPLREPVGDALARTDAIIATGGGILPPDLENTAPVFRAAIVADASDSAALRGRRVFAFAGIARPEKFYASLRDIGAEIAGTRDFPDHARYRPEMIMDLVEQAHRLNATPVTTEKDHVRFPMEARPMVKVLRISYSFADPEGLLRLVHERVPHV